MKLLQLRWCCCGCSLKTGSKIIGWLQIIGACIFTTLAVLGMISSTNLISWRILFLEIILGYVSNGLYLVGFGIVLLVGIEKTRTDYINTWLFASLFGIIVYITNGIINIVAIVFTVGAQGIAVWYIIILVITSTIVLVIEYYCLVIVYSFRKQIQSGTIPVRLQEV